MQFNLYPAFLFLFVLFSFTLFLIIYLLDIQFWGISVFSVLKYLSAQK